LQVWGEPCSQSASLTQHVDWIDAKTSVNSSAHEAAPAPAWSMQVCQLSLPLSPVMPNSA